MAQAKSQQLEACRDDRTPLGTVSYEFFGGLRGWRPRVRGRP